MPLAPDVTAAKFLLQDFLVDREPQLVTLFSAPADDDYSASLTAPFGSPLQLPAPFAFALETADFLP